MQGAARIGTEVKVNGVVASRQGEYFRYEGTASGTAARWLDHSLNLNGSTLISGRKKYVPPQTESVGHDIVGNRIQDGRWEMAWDGENRLIDVRTRDAAVSEGVPKQRLRYTYDPDGRLIERRRFSWSAGDWVLSETTRYLNDGWQCVGEFNGSNTLQRRQVWGLDLDGSRGGMGGIGGLLWIASQANGTHYATSDGSGNVVGLFDTNGSISGRYVYSPFGELLQLSGGAIAVENPWRFSSKRQDPTTDWIHYEYRIYDPMSGRWLSRDPIGEAGGENLYGFVGNDPVNRVDLWGLAVISWLGGFGWSGEEADEYEASIGESCQDIWGGITCTAERIIADPGGFYNERIDQMSDRYAKVIIEHGDDALEVFMINDLTGGTLLVEAISGIDLLEGQELTDEERIQRGLNGFGQAAFTASGVGGFCRGGVNPVTATRAATAPAAAPAMAKGVAKGGELLKFPKKPLPPLKNVGAQGSRVSEATCVLRKGIDGRPIKSWESNTSPSLQKKGQKHIATNESMADFIKRLKDRGFTPLGSSGGGTQLNSPKSGVSYTVKPQSQTGPPTAYRNSGSGQTHKIRFGQPR